MNPGARRLMAIALAALTVVGCASQPKEPELKLRAVTAEEAELLVAMRKDGAAVVTDGCVFAKGLSGQQTIGLQESRELARLSAGRIKMLAEANGIRITQAISPLICGSHAHLKSWPVGNSVDASGAVRAVPLREQTIPTDLADDYRRLMQMVTASHQKFPLPGKCLWCWPYRTNVPVPVTATEEQAQRLRSYLGSRWVLTGISGGFVETTASVALRNTGAALVSIVALFAGVIPHGIGGRYDQFRVGYAVIDLETRQITWRFQTLGVETLSHTDWTSDDFKNYFYPLLGAPSLNCIEHKACRRVRPEYRAE